MRDVLGPVLSAAVREPAGAAGRQVDPGPDAADGRRGPQPQPRRLADGAARAVPVDRRASTRRRADIAEVLRFIGGNEHFFLNLGMPTAKLAMDAARDVPGSTMVTVMARNGTEFGIQTAGTGDRWFTGPANTPVGLFLGDYGPEDANPDIGDSAIIETYGVGGFAMAAAPAIVRFVGGTVPDALATTERMYQITLAENPAMQIPIMGFRGLADRDRRRSRWPAPAGCRRSTRAWPAGWPAPARSAPAWCSRRRSASSRRWRRSPRSPAPPRGCTRSDRV